VVHRPRDSDVVVGQEDETVADVELAGEAFDVLDHLLARMVGRMGLAREHELQRTVGIEQEAAESVGVREQQRRPLVGREAASEADRQDVGIEDVVAHVVAHELDQAGSSGERAAPDRFGGDACGACP